MNKLWEEEHDEYEEVWIWTGLFDGLKHKNNLAWNIIAGIVLLYLLYMSIVGFQYVDLS